MPDHPEPVLKDSLQTHTGVFSDVFTTEGDGGHGPSPAHLHGILRFVQRSANAPLLIHCWAGRSRSTAVALVVITQMLWDRGMDGAELVHTATSALLELRPMATPNRLVLQLGLEVFLPGALGKTLPRAFLDEPRIQKNFAAWRQSLLDEMR